MNKYVGYVIAVAGLVVMALGFDFFSLKLAVLENVNPDYLGIGGVVLVVVGVLISMKFDKGSRKSKQADEEVPIYEGTGKNRKIVGYRRG